MPTSPIDLAYLERFCKGDRSRMEKYILIYLDGAPELFAKLKSLLLADDAEGLAMAAHSLRPQVNYMGAQRLFDLLTDIEQRARNEGAAGCTTQVDECLLLNETIMAELQLRLGQASA